MPPDRSTIVTRPSEQANSKLWVQKAKTFFELLGAIKREAMPTSIFCSQIVFYHNWRKGATYYSENQRLYLVCSITLQLLNLLLMNWHNCAFSAHFTCFHYITACLGLIKSRSEFQGYKHIAFFILLSPKQCRIGYLDCKQSIQYVLAEVYGIETASTYSE